MLQAAEKDPRQGEKKKLISFPGENVLYFWAIRTLAPRGGFESGMETDFNSEKRRLAAGSRPLKRGMPVALLGLYYLSLLYAKSTFLPQLISQKNTASITLLSTAALGRLESPSVLCAVLAFQMVGLRIQTILFACYLYPIKRAP